MAEGVVAVVHKVEAINALSRGQRDRIHASLQGAEAMRDAIAVPGVIVERLGAMLEERNRLIAANFAGLQAMVDEFQDLRGAVDVISKVADKAFFLAVNASIEAHHQGRAGAAFGLIATEMRELASQTSEGARKVSQSINAFADRMHDRVAAAMPQEGGDDRGQGERSSIAGLVSDLLTAQTRMHAAGARLDEAIHVIDAGHGDMVRSLSDILGNLQFQDVMRQRLEQVFGALRDLEDLVTRTTTGAPPKQSLLEVLERQQQRYVMDSQRSVHDAVLAGAVAGGGAGARKIELF